MSKKVISLVIPAYNERGNLPPLMDHLKKVLEFNHVYSFQVIIVDDGSTDKSEDDLDLLEKRLENKIDFLTLSSNFGHEVAMRAGLDHSKGEAVVFLDADLQHPPQLINDMLRAWERGKKLVLTRRIKNDDNSLIYEKISYLYYKILHNISDGVLSAHNTPDFRLIDKKYVKRLKQYKEKTYFLRGMISLVASKKDIFWLDFKAESRHSGVSKYSLTKLFILALDSFISFSIKPLRLLLIIAMILSFCGVVFFTYILTHWYFIGGANYGFYTIVCSILIFGSLNTLLTAIVGEYVARIHNEVKNRPPYHLDTDRDKF